MATVILGGGIIGLSTAYYLSLLRPPSNFPNPAIHVVDSSSELLASASGYAGGFVAEDWFSPSVAPLGALSFRLHRDLANANDGQHRWGYAGSHVYSLSVDRRGIGKPKSKRKTKDWLREGTSRADVASNGTELAETHNGAKRDEMLNDDGTPAWITPQEGGTCETLSDSDKCAQVEPRELCEFLLSECKARGVQLHLSTITSAIIKDDDSNLTGLQISQLGKESIIQCTKVLLAAGAWTPRLFRRLFPRSNVKIPIDAIAGYSLLYRSPRYRMPFINPSGRKLDSGQNVQMCYGVFCASGSDWSGAPEVFARLARGGQTELWIGGVNDTSFKPLEFATDTQKLVDPAKVKELRRITVQLTGQSAEGSKINEDDLETIREGLCFRPASRSGSPILHKFSGEDIGLSEVAGSGLWIASGHGPWGISLSLGTGLVMSEIMNGKKPSAHISGLGL